MRGRSGRGSGTRARPRSVQGPGGRRSRRRAGDPARRSARLRGARRAPPRRRRQGRGAGRRHDEAEDISQDAFLRAFHRLRNFRGDASFRAWLLQIAHNAAIDHLTRRRPEPIDTPDELGDDPERAVSRLPAERLDSRERVGRLERKLRGLSPEGRIALVLRDVEGLSYDEIAAVTQAPLGTVKVRLHRARRDLIEMLRTNTYDWELPE